MTSSEIAVDDTSASTDTLPPYRQQMTIAHGTDEHDDVDDEDSMDVEVEFRTRTAEDDVCKVSQPFYEVTDDSDVPSFPMDVDAGASTDVTADADEGTYVDTGDMTLPQDFSVFLQWSEMEHVLPVTDSRGLVGDWTALMYRQFHDVYPTCALHFRYNHCRKSSSRKTSSPFWIGKATCRTGNCISVTMTMRDEPVAGEK